jgi:Tol biopolymer transport system component
MESRYLKIGASAMLFVIASFSPCAAQVTQRVSVATGGAQANGGSSHAQISQDSRFVVFQSLASNLVAGDTNGVQDVFVHNRLTGETSRINVSSAGGQANGASYTFKQSISADGRLVVFSSNASNLVAGDANGTTDVFLRDRQLAQTTRLSLAPGGG